MGWLTKNTEVNKGTEYKADKNMNKTRLNWVK